MPGEHSIRIQRCLDRLRDGDSAARDELLRHACDCLQRLTRKMLNDYKGVRRWEETGDIFQNAMIRLCKGLNDVTPPTVRDFYRFAALQVRRELIDLARHHYGPEGGGAHHITQSPRAAAEGDSPQIHEQAADAQSGPQDLAQWSEFHLMVDKLPDDERAVFDLIWYQGLSQEEAAELLDVNVRTIKRRWREARVKLHEALGGEAPEL
ncbi:MAG: sigma-70 family RNA polymerase sigma factor [Planctomycetes bacterium]|nr:sigma-70 family RNA polymerase sigma factor [Planctomycetota bacterium]